MRPQRWTTQAVVLLLAALAAVLGLTACGSSSSSSSEGTTTASPPADGPSEATPGKPSPAQVRAEIAADRRAAGRAAPFVKPRSDNSVPTFGSEAGAAERAAAEAPLKAYLEARQAKQWASACRYLAASTRQGFEKLAKHSAGCGAVLGALSKGADLADPLRGKLLSLRVQGINGFALFYGPGHQQYMEPMNREGGKWRLTQTTPIAYPPAFKSTSP